MGIGKIKEFDVNTGNWTLYCGRVYIATTLARGARFSGSAKNTGAGSSAGRASSCKACGGQHQIDGCRFKEFVCSSCRNKGHLRRVCPHRDASKPNGGKGAGAKRGGGGGWRNQEANYVCPADSINEESSAEVEVDEPMFQMSLGHYTPVSLNVTVNGRKLKMEVDTGTPGSCISKKTYDALFSDVKLEKSKYVFLFYDGKSKVKPLGCMTTCVEYNGHQQVLDLFVIDTGVTSLIGRQWLAELGIQIPIFQYPNVTSNFKLEPVKHVLDKMLDRYKENKELVATETAKNCRTLSPGDSVWYRNFSSNTKWSDGQVIERLGRNNYSVKARDGSAAHRHIDQLKRRSSCVFPSDANTSGVAEPEPSSSLKPQTTSVLAKPSVSVEAMDQHLDGPRTAPDLAAEVDSSKQILPPGTETNLSAVDEPSVQRVRKPVVRFGLDIPS
ncbi:Uncharacterized protein OBRU01_00672 [Operophtera brumata]|uniref:CCHC-type domain-containing protein n=1 Tax=Operophtera brumata TaxID=104452 RepID=A0A0L7LNV7_OPEBR|nr:Uncharacterized protein OBRU01_00672 [Operophtera brumata]